jgi:hypothetical protein
MFIGKECPLYCGSGYHSDQPLPKSKIEVELFILENTTHVQRIGVKREWENYA